MQSSASPFVVNIVPLANVVTNSSGEDATTVLSNQLAQVQQMVNFDQKRIYTDNLGAFTTDGSIQVLSPLNLCNVGISSNNVPLSGTGSTAGGGSTIGAASTSITLFNTSSALSTAMTFQVGQRPVFQILGGGNGLVYDSSGIATEFRVSSMTFTADLGVFSTVQVSSDMTVGGICYAQQFVTLSDERRKRSVSPVGLDGILSSLSGINTYYYKLSEGDPVDDLSATMEIGLLAQELEGSFPEVIQRDTSGTKYVKYNSVVALLLGAVRQLNQRVDQLEKRL